MSDHSKIEWTDASWNPVTGCTKVSDGCKHCYAERDWARLAAPRAKPNIYTGRDFTDVRCHPERLDQPLRWTKPRRIFVNSMSDLFHEDIPSEFIAAVFHRMAMAPQHIFQILTKRPERMLNFLTGGLAFEKPLPNVWLGVSCEDQATADERIPLLLQTPAAVRFISAEPLLGPIDLWPWVNINLPSRWPRHAYAPRGPFLDWLIAGGESGPRARPSHPDWFRSLRDQCQAAGVPFFFKQWGEWAPFTYIDENRKALLRIGYSKHEEERECVVGEHSAAINMRRVGKKAAGRSLDGRTWDEYPCS
jgi:protein gp37